jgi:hypothetical protein
MLKRIWVDPVWSKVIANAVWYAGGAVATTIVAAVVYFGGWWGYIIAITSKIISLAVASTLVPNWLLVPICLLAAYGLFILPKALHRHIAGQDWHDHQHNTLSIVPLGDSFYCSPALWHNQLATSLSGTWYFTNITDHPVSLVAAYITSPRNARTPADRMAEHVLQPHVPQSIRVQFLPYPAVHQQGKAFKATVVFVDQYDNKHLLKNILFKVPAHLLFRSE